MTKVIKDTTGGIEGTACVEYSTSSGGIGDGAPDPSDIM